MKKILLSLYFTRSISVEGGGTQLRALANVLLDRGFDPTLHACFSDSDTAPCPVIDYHKDKRIYYRRYLRHLSGLLNDFDSVWVFDHSPAANFAALGTFPDAPHVLRIFGSPCQSWTELFRPPFSRQYTMHCAAKNTLLARAAPPRGRRFVVGTHYQKAQLEGLGIDGSAVHVIPLGIERSGTPDTTKEKARRAYGFGDGPLIAYLGHFSPIKGVPILVNAFRELSSKLPEAHLAVATSGKGAESARVQRMLQAPELEGRVTLLGIVEARQFLRAADVAVLPFVHSSFPHFPLVMVEAFSVGTPVVASDIGGMNEMIQDGETGRLVAPNNPGQLAAVLLDLLGNPTEREHIAANQLQSFRDRYCAEAAVDRLMEIL